MEVPFMYLSSLRSRYKPEVCLLLPLIFAPSIARAQQTPAPSASSEDVVARIKDEGMNRSQVMQTLSYLTDVIGPRLTASPSMKRANEWTRDKMTSWGLSNAHLEAWGPFGRGWSLERFSAQIISPQDIPLIAYPKAWSPGLKGPHVGEVVYIDAKTEADLEKYRGKLKGAIVLNTPVREIAAHFEAMGARLTDEQLKALEEGRPRQRPRPAGAPGPAGQPGQPGQPGQGARGGGRGGQGQFGGAAGQDFRARQAFAARKALFLLDEGVALLVDSSPRGDGGTLFVQSASVPTPPPPPLDPAAPTPETGRPFTPPRRISPWDKDAPKILPQIVIATEHYNRLMRMIQQGETLKMAVDLSVKFYDKDLMGYNTVAEIPGSDLKDQVVMLGAHMDSWHSGTGATDNAAGDAVCMEAVRILKTLNLQPRRTVRVALWSGEEEGLFGSRAYVAEHFATRPTPSAGGGQPGGPIGGGGGGELVKKPEYEKLSGYFNLDNGTGKIRGVYLQGNEAVGPTFREWLAPFKDMGASTITISNTGGTDHQSFDGVGLPGFQFIQDEIEYETRTHHSNQDVYDRIQADDMKQAAVIMAAFVYNTAMRDEMLPRKTQARPTAPTP
jgi:carboxypeptidase Q